MRAGLWEGHNENINHNANLLQDVDWNVIYRIAEEQSVLGLVAAGIEHVADIKVPKDVALTFAGTAMQLEQRNTAMNSFIGETVAKLRKSDIYSLLLKGQGVALCYERPLWRASGDVDLYLSESEFLKARDYFLPLVDSIDPEVLERALRCFDGRGGG